MAKKSVSTPKPRDPFVQHMTKRSQGPHQKPYKNLRRQMKETLAKSARKGGYTMSVNTKE